ncbi:MAG: tetratricopeptide repeat protein [Myxococcota bacterium]
MKNTFRKSILLVPLALLVACQNGASPEAEPLPIATSVGVVEHAVVTGRLASMPEGLTSQHIQASPEASQRHEREKQLNKPILAVSKPSLSPEQAAERILALHHAVPVSGDVRLSLELAKEDFVLGEPITVRAILENTTDHTLRFPPLLDPQFGYNQFIITTPSGKKLGYSAVAIACSRGELQFEALAPGETRVADLPIFFHRDGWIFAEPGEYRIQALYRSTADAAQRADSNELRLVVQPGSAEDQAAARLLMGHEQGLFMMWGEGDHLEEGIAALEDVVSRYPNSLLATYGRYALASNLSVNFMDGRFQQERKARPADVLRLLQPVLGELKGVLGAEVPPSVLKGAYLKAAEAHVALGEREQARQTLREFLSVQADVPSLSADDVQQVSLLLEQL